MQVLFLITLNQVLMVAHTGPLLKPCPLGAGEPHPPGGGGAQAQGVGGAGGSHVSVISWLSASTGEAS